MHPHTSVLLSTCLDFFRATTLHTFADCTLGAGGHAEAFLKNHPEIQLFLGIDQDQQALKIAKNRLIEWEEKSRFIQGNFLKLDTYFNDLHISNVDGILFDLGVSSMQLDQGERGFSFMKNGPLDMRMDTSSLLTAEDVVNQWSEKELGRIFKEYGEESRWRAAAKAIVQARLKGKMSTTDDLVKVLAPILGSYSKRGLHPMTLVFQALRICVNKELEVLPLALSKAISLLSPKGRLAVISFHSLEDRIVKQLFRYEASNYENDIWINKEPRVRILTKKPISPSFDEIKNNPRARSAKLRVVEKI